jgi:putative solute:sodium symporter small subunit
MGEFLNTVGRPKSYHDSTFGKKVISFYFLGYISSIKNCFAFFDECQIKPRLTVTYMSSSPSKMEQYWKKNLQTLAILLFIWFIVSFGCGILWVEELNTIRIGGFKLGFWFAQQGAIYAFLVLIFIYVIRMNKLDKEFNVNED